MDASDRRSAFAQVRRGGARRRTAHARLHGRLPGRVGARRGVVPVQRAPAASAIVGPTTFQIETCALPEDSARGRAFEARAPRGARARESGADASPKRPGDGGGSSAGLGGRGNLGVPDVCDVDSDAHFLRAVRDARRRRRARAELALSRAQSNAQPQAAQRRAKRPRRRRKGRMVPSELKRERASNG